MYTKKYLISLKLLDTLPHDNRNVFKVDLLPVLPDSQSYYGKNIVHQPGQSFHSRHIFSFMHWHKCSLIIEEFTPVFRLIFDNNIE